MDISFNWQPEPILLEKLMNLAHQRCQSPETIVTEAVQLYLDNQKLQTTHFESDPLIGLFKGSPDLATQSEDILQQEITEHSGWTWKEIQP